MVTRAFFVVQGLPGIEIFNLLKYQDIACDQPRAVGLFQRCLGGTGRQVKISGAPGVDLQLVVRRIQLGVMHGFKHRGPIVEELALAG